MFASGLAAFGAMAGLNYMAADKAARHNEEAMKNRHQWEVNDLRTAGLNPILSAGGGGTAGMPGVAAHASPDMYSALKVESEVNQIDAQIEKIKQETKNLSQTEVGIGLDNLIKTNKNATLEVVAHVAGYAKAYLETMDAVGEENKGVVSEAIDNMVEGVKTGAGNVQELWQNFKEKWYNFKDAWTSKDKLRKYFGVTK